MQTREISLDGHRICLEDIIAVARSFFKVSIAETAVKAMEDSRQVVEQILLSNTPAYGINTGFGALSGVAISPEKSNELQKKLLLSHCAACGNPYPDEVVRAMLLLRANALCSGFSGVRPVVVETLVEMLNRGVHPIVPEKGSLGASGDLAPLSHLALVLLGLGEARFQNKTLPGAEAMKLAGIPVIELKAKEGLALINGTQAMSAVGALALYDALHACQMADLTASLSLEALRGITDPFVPRVHALRPHPGQSLVAKNLSLLCQGSHLTLRQGQGRIQDAYSLRCAPQVHGACRDALQHVREVLEREFNSVTDNPLIFMEDGAVISGGHFHGEPVALVLDYLAIAVSELASISERRLERLVNPQLSNGLPPFLAKNSGVESGFMITQYSAASMVSENKVLSHPASVDSIPSSANQEDHVSMGTTAARKARLVVENTLSVLAFELLAACQALDLREENPSPLHQEILKTVRETIPFYDSETEIRLDIVKAESLTRSDRLIQIVKAYAPEFQ